MAPRSKLINTNKHDSEKSSVSAVFLDRDGTLVEDNGYCIRPEDLRFIPGAGEATRMLKDAGYLVVLITNQSAVGRGLVTLDGLNSIHNCLLEGLEKEGGTLDSIYLCPHHPDDGCQCRKPKPGMIVAAADELGINLASSIVIGDKRTDVDAALAAGCWPILLESGCARVESAGEFAVAENIQSAIRMILANSVSIYPS